MKLLTAHRNSAVRAAALVLVVGLFFGVPIGASSASPTAGTSTESKLLVRTYSVEGMTCEGCTGTLVSYLEDQDEVKSATVSFAKKLALVEFNKGISSKQADDFMERMSEDWGGAYKFTPKT